MVRCAIKGFFFRTKSFIALGTCTVLPVQFYEELWVTGSDIFFISCASMSDYNSRICCHTLDCPSRIGPIGMSEHQMGPTEMSEHRMVWNFWIFRLGTNWNNYGTVTKSHLRYTNRRDRFGKNGMFPVYSSFLFLSDSGLVSVSSVGLVGPLTIKCEFGKVQLGSFVSKERRWLLRHPPPTKINADTWPIYFG